MRCHEHTPRSRVSILVCCAMVSFLASDALYAGPSDHRIFTIKQPFTIAGERGIGANPVLGVLMINAREEQTVASRVLLRTIQSLQLSVVNPSGVADPLLPKHEYSTDVLPLLDQDVESYNKSAPDTMRLDTSAYYGLQFKIRYEIRTERDRYFYFELSPILEHRGAASSQWHEYRKVYSGEYFANRFERSLKDNFAAAEH
jgi:hypothetical protein